MGLESNYLKIYYHHDGASANHIKAHNDVIGKAQVFLKISDKIESEELKNENGKADDYLYVKRGFLFTPLLQSLRAIIETSGGVSHPDIDQQIKVMEDYQKSLK